MIREALILAGGLGTRLRNAVPEWPKVLAPVAGRPFLSFVIDYLRMQGIERFIFSTGYKSELVQEFLKKDYPTLDYLLVKEEDPLGTGGGIRLALTAASAGTVLIANGDTLFRASVEEMERVHLLNHAECTLALKSMENSDRYGVVELEGTRITGFREKDFYARSLINGGLYLINREAFLERNLPQKFSFEKDYLEKYVAEKKFSGSVQDGYFIDIGIPEDYNRAQKDLDKPVLDLKKIDREWTVFLDRDGVINEERPGEYVLHRGEFIFTRGAREAIRILGEKFGRVLVVSNQRGIGKKLMTEKDLEDIHGKMVEDIEKAGGRIDGIYYCTEVSDLHFYRKPNPGLATRALRDFPEIDPARSIMVGNKPGDMRFGRSAGFFTVFIQSTNPDQPFPHPDIDQIFPSLYEFSKALELG